jgi:methylthioribose-1-phosphate isomerase
MLIDGVPYRTIRVAEDGHTVEILDQTQLPHAFRLVALRTLDDALRAIRTMQVRGAPLIGVTAAYGLCLALRADPSDAGLARACDALLATRPTAVNLRWALGQMRAALAAVAPAARATSAYGVAAALADEDVALCRAIGEHGLELLADAKRRSGSTLQVLTHCNAGWLAAVDWGTALAPIYAAHDGGLAVHVWVDETRPRNQGASLTAWELGQHGVPHTVIADNAGGHLMRAGRVDVCLTGADRVAANGDVCNKIGTYLKALAAHDNGVPFYAALPYSTIDWTLGDGGAIPIEERDAAELAKIRGRSAAGALVEVELLPPGSAAVNPAFDVTPARLVTGLVTERGVCEASREGLLSLYPEQRGTAS